MTALCCCSTGLCCTLLFCSEPYVLASVQYALPVSCFASSYFAARFIDLLSVRYALPAALVGAPLCVAVLFAAAPGVRLYVWLELPPNVPLNLSNLPHHSIKLLQFLGF